MKKIVILWLSVLLLSGCGIFPLPSEILNKAFTPENNTRYYEKKAYHLVKQLIRQMDEENSNLAINRIAVMDLVDHTGRVPELGRYISLKIANEISKNKYFKLTPRGDLLGTMNRLRTGSNNFEVSTLNELGDALKIEAIIVGKIIDLGTNLDVNVNSVDIKTGEIIASASTSIARSDFATEMLRKY